MTTYPFTEQEMARAAEEWGCNCGPSALAFALRMNLDKVRPLIPGFDEKLYTSPTMMAAALASAGAKYRNITAPDIIAMCHEEPALVRVQWTGPWTAPGMNPRWAYIHTHWVCTWQIGKIGFVFDCNGGILNFSRWMRDIVPLLIPKRGDGKWKPTHIWRISSSPIATQRGEVGK